VSWRWRPWAVSKSPEHSGDLSSFIVIAVLAGGVALVFHDQLIGSAVFIGESDRLNSYLNMRLAEYDALRTHGRVPAWNPTMFAGFSVPALHWMYPGTDPVAYLLQLFARDLVYVVLGYVSIALVLAACATAYLYIRDLTGTRVSAAVAALCYGLSVFAVHRFAQVDNALLTLVLLPAAMLAIRRVRTDNLVLPFVGLTLSMSALAFWGFLQEVAYAFCFLAAYALCRAATARAGGPRAVLAVLIAFGIAALVALLLAAPRLITLVSELAELERMSASHYAGYPELLRFFHEGIYGRYFGEGRSIGNSLNLHEGLQLLSSTTVVLLVCLGVLRPSTRLQLVAGSLLVAMLVALVPMRRVPIPGVSQELSHIALIGLIVATIALIAVLRGLLPPAPHPTDTAFHLVALVSILFLILVPEGYDAIHTAFARMDFTHSRLSILAVLPLCSLFAIYLAELRTLRFRAAAAAATSAGTAAMLLVLLGAALLSWLIHGPVLDRLFASTSFQLNAYPGLSVVPIVAAKVVLTAVILAALLAGLLCYRHHSFDGRIAATVVVATFAVVETVTYAHFKVNGSHTWTYPAPFDTFNYMNVPPAVMRPPTDAKLKALAEKLEAEDFRSALLTRPSMFSGAMTSHISQFWRTRMIGGYGTGVPKRLADLPWPEGVLSLRMIELRTSSHVNPELLALLNVKYLVVATAALYFDAPSERATAASAPVPGDAIEPDEVANIDGIAFGLIRNPVAAVPRHFLVERVTGVTEPPRLRDAAIGAPAHPAGESLHAAFALVHERIERLTRHSLAEKLPGSQTFDASGPLDVAYRADIIEVRVAPSDRDRFLVINERYHTKWRARAESGDIPIHPTNAVMMGVRIPAKLDRIELRFEPFSATRTARMLMLLAVLVFLAATAGFLLVHRRTAA
jgi:hypothetical protein